MNCNDVSTILDERRERRLTAAEHCAVDTHLTACADCSDAWHAQAALLALPVPRAPADLLERALALRPAAPRRRATTRLALGAALLAAGAALAAVTYWTVAERGTVERRPADPPAPGTRQASAQDDVPPQTRAVGADTAPSASPSPAYDVEKSRLPDSEYFLVSRIPPVYPKPALEQQVQGSVSIEFTITKEGRVADAIAVEPTDAEFASAAIAALSQWTYLPRVIDGERVAVHDVKTTIRFQLLPDSPSPKAPATDYDSPEFVASLARAQLTDQRLDAALKCLMVQELRCAELILDELVATNELTPEKSPAVWDFYGYLYTQYGDYGRAIAAYEAAIRDGTGWGGGEWLALAHLYFARNQYDMAMKTLLRYKVQNTAPFPGTEEFLERLRSLGITEDVL